MAVMPPGMSTVSPDDIRRLEQEMLAKGYGGFADLPSLAGIPSPAGPPRHNPQTAQQQDPLELVMRELDKLRKDVKDLHGFIEYAAEVSPEVKAYMAGWRAKGRIGIK